MASTQDVSQWLDTVLARKVPARVVAYCVNIYETAKGYDIELVGAGEFDPDDSDWPCAEVFTTRKDLLSLTRRKAGADWKKAFAYVKKQTKKYLARDSAGATKLKASKAVAVGFVDGDLSIVWRARRKTLV